MPVAAAGRAAESGPTRSLAAGPPIRPDAVPSGSAIFEDRSSSAPVAVAAPPEDSRRAVEPGDSPSSLAWSVLRVEVVVAGREESRLPGYVVRVYLGSELRGLLRELEVDPRARRCLEANSTGLLTDSLGVVELAVPAGERYGVRARSPGGISLYGRSAEPEPGEAVTERLELLFAPTRWSGVVVDAETGARIPDADVEARGSRSRVAKVRSDGSGRFELDVDAEQAVELDVSASGFVGRRFLAAAELWVDGRLAIALEPEARLAVRVVDPLGEPLRGALAKVYVAEEGYGNVTSALHGLERRRGWRDSTNSRGQAEIGGLPRGTPLLLVVEKGALMQKRGFELGEGTVASLNVTLSPGAHLTGTIRGRFDEPLERSVRLVRVGTGAFEEGPLAPANVAWRSASDSDGRFEFQGVQPGTWQVRPVFGAADEDPDGSKPLRSDTYGQFPVVRVTETTKSVHVDVYDPRGLYVSGLLIGRDGRPEAGLVTLTGLGRRRDVHETEAASSSGEFRFGPVPPGNYRLRTRSWDPVERNEVELKVRAGDAGVVLRR